MLFPTLLIFCAITASYGQNKPNSAAIDWIEKSETGAYRFGYATNDEGGHYHAASATADNTVAGKFGYKDPVTGGDLQTTYTAGRRGFRARGPHIARRMDLSQNKPPFSRPNNDGKYHPELDNVFDPTEDRGYDFAFQSADQVKEEHANSIGDVQGRYSYLDDVGIKHNVDYIAGSRTGFQVTNPVPDTFAQAQGGPLYYVGKGPGSKARGFHAIQKGLDGSYRFVSSGPDQKRNEVSDAIGNRRGSYTYLDDKGAQHTVEYIAGPNIGFKVINNRKGMIYPFYPDISTISSGLTPSVISSTTFSPAGVGGVSPTGIPSIDTSSPGINPTGFPDSPTGAPGGLGGGLGGTTTIGPGGGGSGYPGSGSGGSPFGGSGSGGSPFGGSGSGGSPFGGSGTGGSEPGGIGAGGGGLGGTTSGPGGLGGGPGGHGSGPGGHGSGDGDDPCRHKGTGGSTGGNGGYRPPTSTPGGPTISTSELFPGVFPGSSTTPGPPSSSTPFPGGPDDKWNYDELFNKNPPFAIPPKDWSKHTKFQSDTKIHFGKNPTTPFPSYDPLLDLPNPHYPDDFGFLHHQLFPEGLNTAETGTGVKPFKPPSGGTSGDLGSRHGCRSPSCSDRSSPQGYDQPWNSGEGSSRPSHGHEKPHVNIYRGDVKFGGVRKNGGHKSHDDDFFRIPTGVAVRAHVQSLDIVPYNKRFVSPGEAIERFGSHERRH